ncbi:hypothetical protein AB0425_17310 [Actinosynnema sp. NPDC051121]
MKRFKVHGGRADLTVGITRKGKVKAAFFAKKATLVLDLGATDALWFADQLRAAAEETLRRTAEGDDGITNEAKETR